MMVIARESEDGKPIHLAEVADRTRLSRRYLEQIVISLKTAGLLRAVQGKNGGHMLAKPPEQINLGEIVEAAIGEINIVECVQSPDNCFMSENCECRGLYRMINQRIREAFNSFTLADLAQNRVSELVGKELG